MKFTYHPRIIKQLGTELITSDSIALSELIKNAFDAKATTVHIRFLDCYDKLNKDSLIHPIPEVVEEEIHEMASSFIIIEDNGTGMNKERLEKGFFEVGSDIKEADKLHTNDDEIILGNKGIGRLSTQRLGPVLFVETCALNKRDEHEINFVKVIWEEFEKNRDAEAQEWQIVPQAGKTYTRLWISSTPEEKIDFNKFFIHVEEQEKDLFGEPYGPTREYYKLDESILSTLNYLYSPFEINESPLKLLLEYNNEPIKAEFNKDNLAIAECVHSFKVQGRNDQLYLKLNLDIRPWFIQRIHYGMVGEGLFQDYKKEAKYYREIQDKYAERFSLNLEDEIPIQTYLEKKIKKERKNYSHETINHKVRETSFCISEISPIEGEIFSFKRDRKMLDMAYASSLENGYRNRDTKINDIKEFLESYNGIKLYRNGFRIATLGDKSSDWLKLQQKRTTGQQFYRFELGNALGYVRINDPKQNFIYETSSREDITDLPHKKALADLLDYIFNDRFYHLTKNAVEITKDILDEEGLIPKNKSEDIEKESKNAKELLAAAEKNLKAFSDAFSIIKENKDLDSEEKITVVRNILGSVDDLALSLGGSVQNSFQALKSADTILNIAKEEKKRIEIETYNNYKLMANGLVTEVITHELHSLIQDRDNFDYENKIDAVKDYLFANNNPVLYKENLYPVKKRLEQVSNKMTDLQQFYNFLEKTFIYSGKADDFENQNLKEFLESFAERNQSRLNKYRIEHNFQNTDEFFSIPRGAFMHIFYNLFDNSIYWIAERQSRANYDKSFSREGNDVITVRVKDKNTLQYFDSGTGVLEKYQYILFQPMVSGKENGRGMGMYIIRKFLESFDAKIELLNDVNEYGNRYIFEITFNSQF